MLAAHRTLPLLACAIAVACSNPEDIRPTNEGVIQEKPVLVDAANPDVVPDAVDAANPDVVREAVVDSPPAPTKCPEGLPGPELVLIPAPDGTTYCIDRTEVTQGQYKEFLTANNGWWPFDTSDQPEECQGNQRLVPEGAIQGPDPCILSGAFDLDEYPSYPVGCVDWCDAFAFCKWAGKRLCGRIGGGAVAETERADATRSEWYNVCSQGGKTRFAYGNTYEPGTCVDAEYQSANPATVHEAIEVADKPASCAGRTSPFDQVLNLSGNRGEWEDSCGEWNCSVRGISYQASTAEEYFACAVKGSASRSSTDYHLIGFRCCADAE